MRTCSVFLVFLIFASAVDAAESRPPRAARSVHLGWSAPDGEVFYNEMVVEQSVPGSYFMAVGWNTGYFGIQELNAATNKVVIFSVWDPTRGDNANAVPVEQRVEVLHSDPGVRIKRFGGGFRTTTKGSPLKGYYSFVEDFRRDTKSVNEVRRARFGNGWVKPIEGNWVALAQARFTASGASWESKENIDAGAVGDEFYLATGGGTKMSRKLREQISVSTSGRTPPGIPAEFSGKPGE